MLDRDRLVRLANQVLTVLEREKPALEEKDRSAVLQLALSLYWHPTRKSIGARAREADKTHRR